jgi:arginyl-tRNA synthetase
LKVKSPKEEIGNCLRKILSDKYDIELEPMVEVSPKQEYGDFSTNVSSLLPEKGKYSFKEFAKTLVDELAGQKEMFKKVVRVGGFINYFLNDNYLFGKLKDVIKEGEKFGSSNQGKGKKVLVEFVSTNPTGPLNVVNARAAAVGDTLVNILNFTGYQADAEFYINDAGRQVEMLGISAEKRFQELKGKSVEIPEDGYKGKYIIETISKFLDDNKVNNMNEKERISFFKDYVKDKMIENQRKSLHRFGVKFKNWISEQAILEKFPVQEVLKRLKKEGDVYKKDGAEWFSTIKYGDDKDRVLIKQDGTHTYIVSDAAYHKNKFERGYQHLINLWGPDHHGDIMRLKAAVEAFGFDPNDLEIIIVQQVALVSGGEKEKMSKREGNFVTLDSLLDDVDRDAVRFFFLMRRVQAHLDFDVELARKLSLENPVYYTQYCHARISNILEFADEKGIKPPLECDFSLLTKLEERELAKGVLLFPWVVKNAVERREIHKVPYYLLDLSKNFHSYYQKYRVVCDDEKLTMARLLLVRAVKKAIGNGLSLIGVTAPEKM